MQQIKRPFYIYIIIAEIYSFFVLLYRNYNFGLFLLPQWNCIGMELHCEYF